MPRVSKKGASYYKQKADELFSQYVRTRDKRCLYCKSTINLQCAHIEGRRNERLRFDPMNAITLCKRHHLFWAHKEPRQFAQWFDTTFPQNAKYIDEHRNEIEQRKLLDYQEICDELRSMLSSLGDK